MRSNGPGLSECTLHVENILVISTQKLPARYWFRVTLDGRSSFISQPPSVRKLYWTLLDIGLSERCSSNSGPTRSRRRNVIKLSQKWSDNITGARACSDSTNWQSMCGSTLFAPCGSRRQTFMTAESSALNRIYICADSAFCVFVEPLKVFGNEVMTGHFPQGHLTLLLLPSLDFYSSGSTYTRYFLTTV